jgi:hypothetical protein
MIIGLVGFIGSGKGTVGDILADEYGFKRESFAKSVKDALSPIFGWERSLLEGDTVQSRSFREQPDAYWSNIMGRDFTPREALQLMGTEAGRNVFHPEIWVHSLERRLKEDSSYVITDVRFPNEMNMIQRVGGKIIRVRRGAEPEWYKDAEQINYAHMFSSSGAPHSQTMPNYPKIHYSEWAWIGYPMDVTIENDGTLQELRATVDLKVLK